MTRSWGKKKAKSTGLFSDNNAPTKSNGLFFDNMYNSRLLYLVGEDGGVGLPGGAHGEA
jgi:hypothetical protein